VNPAEVTAVLWDAWRAQRGGPTAIARRQTARLAALVRFARERSPLYRELYRGLPAGDVRLEQLPPVTKPRLMADFDAWVTDPAVTRAGIGEFLTDPSLVGRRYRGRYLAITTSGVTNVRAILLHDPAAVLRYRALTLLRGFLPRLAGSTLWSDVRRGNRVAALVIGGGHFGGATIFESARQDHRWPFDRIRVFSVARPVPELVRELNAYQPAQDGNYGNSKRAAFRLPGRNQTDLALSKNFYPVAQTRLQFRADFINAFNHTQWLAVDNSCAVLLTTCETSTFGQITSTRNPREIQLSLKLYW